MGFTQGLCLVYTCDWLIQAMKYRQLLLIQSVVPLPFHIPARRCYNSSIYDFAKASACFSMEAGIPKECLSFQTCEDESMVITKINQ